jgi:hypothetical protein
MVQKAEEFMAQSKNEKWFKKNWQQQAWAIL